MSAMAGNLPGFEEASRALFAGDPERFTELIRGWPEDLRKASGEAGPGGHATRDRGIASVFAVV